MKAQNGYFGKYRGKVESNVDPNSLGRLQVSCPSVLGEGKLSWAMPCTPFAGPKVGLFILPPKGANLWIEFESGDIDYPIWTGCFWDKGDVPASPAAENIKMLKTDSVSLTIDDMKDTGGLTLVIDAPAISDTITLICNSDGVMLNIGDSTLTMTIEDIKAVFAEDASTRLSADGIELMGKESTVDLKEGVIDLVVSDAKVSLTDGPDVELTDGSGKAKLAGGKLTVNDGALTVE